MVLKGFRPGHAPRTLLERLFGDQVRGEIVQKLVKEYTDKALEEQNLKPVAAAGNRHRGDRPRQDAAASVRSSICAPEIVVQDYQGLKVPRSKVEVSDDEVQKTLEDLRERSATLKKVEDRTRVERRRPGAGGDRGLRRRQAAAKVRRSDSASWKFPPTASRMGSTKC